MKRAIFFETRFTSRENLWPAFREMEKHGYKCYFANDKTKVRKWHCDYAFIFCGHGRYCTRFNSFVKRHGIPHAFIESGFFPQLTTCFLSNKGSVGRYLFLGEKIEEATGSDHDLIARKAAQYVEPIAKYRGHTAGMLQLPNDASITTEGRFKTMQEFVDCVEDMYQNDEVIFRAHPYRRDERLRTKNPIERSGSMWRHVLSARRVVGINSTSLYEAALAGKEVVALGDCALSRNEGNHAGVVAEILKREIPQDCQDATEQFRRSLGSNCPF